MAIPLKQLIENPELLERLMQSTPATQKALFETTPYDGKQPTDFYYQQIGELIEQHPIQRARVRRG